MWSKLRKKVLKSNRKCGGDDTDEDSEIILRKFDKIPSYVFEPDGAVSREITPVDWQMALALDNAPKGMCSPRPNGHKTQRPLSTFGVTYSPNLTPRRKHSLINEDGSCFYGMDLDGIDACDDEITGSPSNISVLSQDTVVKVKKDVILGDNENKVCLANGNIEEDEFDCSAGQSTASAAGTITVSMGITLTMNAMKNPLAPLPPPKKDKKYERVVTNEQVIQEQLNSPNRRKRNDLPPVVTTADTEGLPSPMPSLSTGSDHDQLMLSEPSTATSDSVFELELQFERQESGYATLDDGHDRQDKHSYCGQSEGSDFSPVDFGSKENYSGESHMGNRLTPSPVTTAGTSLQTVDVLKGVIPSCTNAVKEASAPPAKPERIYPTFRKQLNSGNNNTPPPSTSDTTAKTDSSQPLQAQATSKPTGVDINQNFRSRKNDAVIVKTIVKSDDNAEGPDVTKHVVSTTDDTQERDHDVDLTRLLREKVEYVPADCSVSKIYRRSRENRGSGDVDGGSSIEDLYASVPKGIQRVSTDEGTATGTSSCSDRSSKGDDECSIAGSEATEKTDETSGTVVGSECNTDDEDPDLADDGIDLSVDINNDRESEDSEPVPPIPEKNYKLLNEGTIIKETLGRKKSSPEHNLANEPTHMSWEEVMNEARTLGIPWKRPQCQSLSRSISKPEAETTRECLVFSRSISKPEGDQHHRESVSSLDMPQSPTSPTCTTPVREMRTYELHQDAKLDRKKSPFKDKFKFQSLFSKKKDKSDKHSHDGHHRGTKYQTVGAHKRNLPNVPPVCAASGSSCTLCTSPRSSKTSLLSVPKSPAANHHCLINREGAGSVASWNSNSSISLSQSSASLGSMASHGSSYGAHHGNFMSLSMTGAIPYNPSGDNMSPTTPTRNINADFIDSLRKLKDSGWYWGPMSWDEAEAKLANKPDGSFLVRDSSDDRYILSLSFRSQSATHHTRIEHYKGMFSFYSQPKSHGAATIVEFIEKAMEHSRSGKFLYFLRPRAPGFPPAPVQLLFPISRFHNMHSLQHLCRFEILKHTRKDLIDRLPIPPRLKEYLKQSQYYTEYYSEEFRDHPLFGY